MGILDKLFGSKEPASLYKLIAPVSEDVLGPWAGHFAGYSEVIGYSSLGHAFLRNPEESTYAVLHPFKGGIKSYGEFGSISEFESGVLKEPGFEGYVLRASHVEQIAKRLGKLKDGEVYIPQPYTMLGGSETPETYTKGNVFVFLHIVGQMGGL